MDDFISRQAVIDILEEQIYINGYSNTGLIVAINRSIGNIMHLPTAEKQGKWVYTKKRLVRGGTVDASECSVCHKIIMPHIKPNYCPNCGARMEE